MNADLVAKVWDMAVEQASPLMVVDGDRAFVVMDIARYSQLLDRSRGLTADEQISKINRDIALWKNGADALVDTGEACGILDELLLKELKYEDSIEGRGHPAVG